MCEIRRGSPEWKVFSMWRGLAASVSCISSECIGTRNVSWARKKIEQREVAIRKALMNV